MLGELGAKRQNGNTLRLSEKGTINMLFAQVKLRELAKHGFKTIWILVSSGYLLYK